MTVNSIALDLPDENDITTRLLQNASDMGRLLRPFYGTRISVIYSDLIRNHLVIAAELVQAEKQEIKKL